MMDQESTEAEFQDLFHYLACLVLPAVKLRIMDVCVMKITILVIMDGLSQSVV